MRSRRQMDEAPALGHGNVELLQKFYEHWERGDFSSTEFFDPQVEYARFGSDFADLAGEWRGLEQLSIAIADYVRAWKDLRMRAERFIDLGDNRVLVFDRHTGRGKSSGIVVEHELAVLFTLRGEKIVRFEAYWDRAEALRAAGIEL